MTFLFFFALCSSSVESHELFHCNKQSVWAHKAYSKGDHTFDIAELEKRIKAGFCGLEIDVYYDEASAVFYVAHNPNAASVKASKLDIIAVANKLSGKRVHIWIDWKNASVKNAKAGLRVLVNSFAPYISKGNYLIVETPNISASMYMEMLNFTNVRVLHWVGYSGKLESLRAVLRDVRSIAIYCFSPFWVSTPSLALIDVCKRNDRPSFVFTVNNIQEIKELQRKGVSVILTDLTLNEIKQGFAGNANYEGNLPVFSGERN